MLKYPSGLKNPLNREQRSKKGVGIRIVGIAAANGTSEAESPTRCKKGSKIAAILLGEGRIHRTMGLRLSNFQFSLLTFPFQSLERKKISPLHVHHSEMRRCLVFFTEVDTFV